VTALRMALEWTDHTVTHRRFSRSSGGWWIYSALGRLSLLPRHLHTKPLQEYSLKTPWWDTSSPSKKFLPSEQADFVAHKVNQKLKKDTKEAPEGSLGNHTDDT
jgi:hypothetical protein